MNKTASTIYLTGAFINILTLVFIKYLGINNLLKIDQIIFFRTLFAVILLTPFNINNIKSFKLENKHTFALLLILGILASVDAYLWNIGLQKVPVNNAMMMLFLSPIITALLSRFILKETIKRNTKISFIINSFAVLSVYHFSFNKFNIGYLFLLSDLFIYGFTAILIKKLSSYSSDFLVFVRLLILLPISFFIMKDIPIFNLKVLLFVALITFGYITERTLLTKAYQLTTITSIQPLRYFNIVFSAGLSYLILGEKLSLWQVLGVVVIIGSGVLLRVRR